MNKTEFQYILQLLRYFSVDQSSGLSYGAMRLAWYNM